MDISVEFKGIWVPRELVLSDLSIYEEKLLSIIWALDKIGSQGCDAGNKYLAKYMKGVQPTRISNILSGLIKQGHLRRTVKYKPGSKEIEKRYLKVISPLLLTVDRINSDPYLNGISPQKAQNTPFIQNEHPLHSECSTPSLRMSTPFTESERYNIVNNISNSSEESAAQKIEKKEEKESIISLKSPLPEVNGGAADHEAEAVKMIHAKICTASRQVKDSWTVKFGSSLKSAGLTPAKSIEECAEYMRVNDRILAYLSGSTLIREIEALPAQRFISFFQNKWLPNIKPAKITSLSSPTVLPKSTIYNRA